MDQGPPSAFFFLFLLVNLMKQLPPPESGLYLTYIDGFTRGGCYIATFLNEWAIGMREREEVTSVIHIC